MPLPAYIKDDKDWEKAFLRDTAHIHGNVHYNESAEMLRKLVRSGTLRFTDLQNNPERFFAAHRALLNPASASAKLSDGSGFGVRFTVQFNLFAGSIVGLGNDEQIEMLDQFQERGVLGCFCLTERFAGVNSGLVVETTATWDEGKQSFLIETGKEGSRKNWISQGLTASQCVVIANLNVGGKFYGPHGFVIPMRDERTGELLPGVTVEDMGQKTVANDLDNACVSFKVWAPHSALLSRFADVRGNKYVQTTKERMRIEIIGQRLLTGRMAIAESAVMFAQKLFAQTKDYARKKKCWAPKGMPQPSLAEIPHIAAIFAEGDSKLAAIQKFNFAVEDKLNAVLRDRSIPTAEMVESIAVAKVKSVTESITLTAKLSREVGSYALMHESGFGAMPWLLMCAFAEGDSRILMQKLARDSMKHFKQTSWTDTGKEIVFGTSAEQQEYKARFMLSRALSAAATPADAARLWNDNWQLVYELAEAVCAKYIAKYSGDDVRLAVYAKL